MTYRDQGRTEKGRCTSASAPHYLRLGGVQRNRRPRCSSLVAHVVDPSLTEFRRNTAAPRPCGLLTEDEI
jgi:hypothetical protein